MRSLGKSLSHLQSAVDRAYLDLKYDGIWKGARLQTADYLATQFVTGISQEGGYIFDFISNTTIGNKIINRVSNALTPAIHKSMESGERQVTNFADQIETRKQQITASIVIPERYELLLNSPPEKVIRKYGDRSIVKEFDQIASIIRSKNVSNDSEIEFKLMGDSTYTFTFNKRISKNFHSVVSEKAIGEPVVYFAKITSLDHGNLKGRIHNVSSKKDANIHFVNEDSFFKASPFLGLPEPVELIGCPLIEYGTFDPAAGDIYFLDISQENG